MQVDKERREIAVLGLGYVGLPLTVEFAKKYSTWGFDINLRRVEQLTEGIDTTGEIARADLEAVQRKDGSDTGIVFTRDIEDIRGCNIYIVTVPTPIDGHNQPDFTPLLGASEAVASVLSKGDVVIFESTVYPGLTEEVCIPVLERVSGLGFNVDFHVGYSPERINPGDPDRRLPDIKKVVSGSTPETAAFVEELYASIISAGTHRTSSIRVAEAAKVIENIQRDVNIALINELAIVFARAGIDTQEVLEAAGTKWNFLPFRPGLVGGHCIGVDPYYLTYKALELGYHPEMILAGRRINDGMAEYIAGQVINLMTKKRIQVVDARILVLGMTFKENCPDIRNTKVTGIIKKFVEFHAKVDVLDPWVDPSDVDSSDFSLISTPVNGGYDAIILAVAHREFRGMGVDAIRELGKAEHILYDVKSLFESHLVDGRL